MKRVLKGLVIIFAALILCQAPGEDADAKATVSKVTVKSNYGSMVHVGVGKKIKLTTTVTVTPNKAKNKKVTYKSSNKKIAKVTKKGYVKGKKTGKCKITVTSKKNKKKKAKITVKVVKKVTSISITKPSGSLYVGKKMKLTANVKPSSGSFNKVLWSSSDPTVATISSSGSVSALKTGTTTIKATSVEGSNKIGTLELTVEAKTNVELSSITVLSEDTVRVVLNKANELAKDQFLVQGKQYSFGSYNKDYTVKKIRNYDNKTYDVILADDQTIKKDSFVRVTVSDLPGDGTNLLETQAIILLEADPKEEYWIGVVGDVWDKEVDLSDYCYGNISYTVTGSIPGITTCKVVNNCLTFSGELTEATTGTDLEIEAVDELGRSINKIVHVLIGDDDTVVGGADSMTAVLGCKYKIENYVTVAGGSGEYTYEADALPEGLSLDTTTGTLSGTPTTAGTYAMQVTVTDTTDSAKTCVVPCELIIVEQRQVTGVVTDVDGNPVSYATVECVNYSDGTYYTATTDKNGAYVLYLGEGTYDIKVSYGDYSDAVYYISVGSAGRTIDFQID